MPEWVHKYSAYMTTIITVIIIIIGWNIAASNRKLDAKADRAVMDVEIKAIHKRIDENKAADNETRTLILEEIRLLREDLKLKKDK